MLTGFIWCRAKFSDGSDHLFGVPLDEPIQTGLLNDVLRYGDIEIMGVEYPGTACEPFLPDEGYGIYFLIGDEKMDVNSTNHLDIACRVAEDCRREGESLPLRYVLIVD